MNIYIYYNPSVRIIDVVSHTTHVVYVNFKHEWRGIYSLMSTLNNRFLRSFSWQFVFTLRVFTEICWEEVAKEIFSYFRYDIWLGVWTSGLTSNKPLHYLLGYGDFTTYVLYHISWLPANICSRFKVFFKSQVIY